MYHGRQSWDTAVKHSVRTGILKDILSPEQIALIPRSNISRWKNEPENKYQFCEVNKIIQEEVDLIKRINQSSRIKNINQSYFKLADAFHEIIGSVKGIKSLLKENKEIVVNTIDQVKSYIPITECLKVFNISRGTYEHYSAMVVHTCAPSYFKWCIRKYANQLLPSEVAIIKEYMVNETYTFWSKSAIYLRALRDKKLHCGLSTFYKYCRLLGYANKPRQPKSQTYRPLKTNSPNEVWCADVTIFKTSDTTKHYIHFLIDHYSRYIIGYNICSRPSATVIKELVHSAYKTYKPNSIRFLTDGGGENVNKLLVSYIQNPLVPITLLIAQKDVVFSNSMVEAVNKVIKHQFLFPKNISSRNHLKSVLKKSVFEYNQLRPQQAIGGNTPLETFQGRPVTISQYSVGIEAQKRLRVSTNRTNACSSCL